MVDSVCLFCVQRPCCIQHCHPDVGQQLSDWRWVCGDWWVIIECAPLSSLASPSPPFPSSSPPPPLPSAATYFMSYTTVLKTSADYVSSLKRVRELTNNLSATLKHEVFAYR